MNTMKSTLVICFLAVAIVTQLKDAEGCSYKCSSRSCSWWWSSRCQTTYRMCPCTHCKFGEFKLQNCGGCSRTCGGGEMTCKYKREIAVHATRGGNPCNEADATKTEKRSCNTHHCPIDGGWSDWSKYSECSKNCDKTKRRTCTNPPPQYGGKYCKGAEKETTNCYEGLCLDAACQNAHEKNQSHHSLPENCVNFVKCHPKGDGKNYHPSLHTCPNGTVWMDHIQTCVRTEDVTKCEPCKDGDLIPHVSDCSKFLVCDNGGLVEMPCPDKTYFNPFKQYCDHDDSVCNNKPCKDGDLIPHESDCSKFFICGNGGLVEMPCPDKTYFNPFKQYCDHDDSLCNNKPCKLGEHIPNTNDCSKYYICGHEGPVEMSCDKNTYFDPSHNVCGYKKDACKI